jgi:hypothetical protein
VCSTRRTRGETACSNRHGVPATPLTDAVLGQLKHIFLNPAALGNLLLRERAERAKAPEALEAQRQDLTATISRLDTELGRLADAVASGSAPSTLVAAIKQREGERRDLQAKLEHVNGLAIGEGVSSTCPSGWLRRKRCWRTSAGRWRTSRRRVGRFYGSS